MLKKIKFETITRINIPIAIMNAFFGFSICFIVMKKRRPPINNCIKKNNIIYDKSAYSPDVIKFVKFINIINGIAPIANKLKEVLPSIIPMKSEPINRIIDILMLALCSIANPIRKIKRKLERRDIGIPDKTNIGYSIFLGICHNSRKVITIEIIAATIITLILLRINSPIINI